MSGIVGANEKVGDQRFVVPVFHVLDVVEHRVGQPDRGAGGDEYDADGERRPRTVDQQLPAGDAAFERLIRGGRLAATARVIVGRATGNISTKPTRPSTPA